MLRWLTAFFRCLQGLFFDLGKASWIAGRGSAGLCGDNERSLRVQSGDRVTQKLRSRGTESAQSLCCLRKLFLSGRTFHGAENPAGTDEGDTELRENIQPCNGTRYDNTVVLPHLGRGFLRTEMKAANILKTKRITDFQLETHAFLLAVQESEIQ